MMDDDVYKLLLNGMPFSKFIVYYIIGLAGGLLFFLGNLHSSIKTDIRTPATFSWRAFLKGGIRVLLSIISLAFAIIYFKEMSPFLFNIMGASGTAETSKVIVDVNPFSAFCLGIGIDRLWQGILKIGSEGVNAGVKAIKKI